MKSLKIQVLILFFALFFTQRSNAQTDYVPMPTEDAVWSVCLFGCTGANPNPNTILYGTNGDTLIDNKIYHKIYTTQDSIWNEENNDFSYHGSFREEDKVVYFIRYNQDTEVVIMDFNMEIGDTLLHYLCLPPGEIHKTTFLAVIDTIELSNGEKRAIYLFDRETRDVWPDTITIYIDEKTHWWIEGIGQGEWRVHHKNSHPNSDILLCYEQDEIQLYNNADFNYCHIPSITNSTYSLKTPDIKIYPNPSNEYCQIRLDRLYKNVSIQLYDLTGVLQVQQDYQDITTATLTLDKLNGSGIFIVKIIADKQILTTKILKN